MPKSKITIFNKLYLQVSLIFLIVLIVFASISLFVSVNSARHYSQEVNQKLNRDLARNMVQEKKSLFLDDSINQAAIQDIMHSMMVINPTVEVYLLDESGNILTYVAPKKIVKLDRVSLGPIRTFLNNKDESIIYGDDPRNPGETRIFSAAEIIENDQLVGYLYIILASQEYISKAQMVLGSYVLGLSVRSVVLILLVTVLVGLIAIWFITKKLNRIIHGIEQFHTGNLGARIEVKSDDELDKVALVFNNMADTIEKNIEELKGIDEFRKEIISNVSHDLRTPVASIQGYAETLLIKKDDLPRDEQLKYIEIIYKSCDHLKKLVNQLFELSKLQTNQVKPVFEPFSITELVHDVANKYRIISQKRGISINTSVTGKVPVVEADISLIDRVLQNLIDNAVRFCKENDYINIKIDLVNPENVEVNISDSGKGIKSEEIPHIFERFYKNDQSGKSTGLGLAIVKKIIDLHNSEIRVSSVLGQGTTFTFHLPVAKLA